MTAIAGKQTRQGIRELWDSYAADRDRRTRDVLLEHYLPLVRASAQRLHSRLPNQVDLDDMVSSGVFGLISAVDAFEPARGIAFETYASPRIRGAILDGLRSMDWAPRLVRARCRQMTQASQALEARLGRRATPRELADRMGLSPDELHRAQRDAQSTNMTSLSRLRAQNDAGRDTFEADAIRDRRSEDPAARVMVRDLAESITRGLTKTERLVVLLYYVEELTMKETGRALDLSESRVSQLHSSIMTRLRTTFACPPRPVAM